VSGGASAAAPVVFVLALRRCVFLLGLGLSLLDLNPGLSHNLEAAPGDKKWGESLSWGEVHSTPAIGADGTVYVGTYYGGVIYALNGATGRQLWSCQPGGMIYSSPAIGIDGTIYIGLEYGKVCALNGATGQKKWEFVAGSGTVHSSPAIGANGTVYVQSDKVYALDGATGQKQWEFAAGGDSSPAVGVDGTVYVGSYDKNVYALDGATGQKKWAFLTGNGVQSSPAIGADGTVYVGSDKVYALDGATGRSKWECPIGSSGGAVSSPAIGADGTVYIQSDKVYALDGTTGQKKWESLTGRGDDSSPAVGSDGTVYVAASSYQGSKVYALDGATGKKKWEFSALIFSSPAIGADGTVYVGSASLLALESSSVGGLAPSPWPKFRGNSRNTGTVSKVQPGPPVILEEPKDVRVVEQSTTTFSVETVGNSPLHYQWFFQGAPLARGTNFAFTLRNAQLTDTGNYFVTVSNNQGMVTSRVARLTVGYGLTVTNHWAGTTVISPALAAYEPGSRVELRAVPLAGHSFMRWSGDVSSGENPLLLTIHGPLNLVAEFSRLPGDLLWEFATGSFQTIGAWMDSSPAIGADGTVYVGSRDHKVYALDGATGRKKWEFLTEWWVEGSPAIGSDGTVYIGSVDDHIYALNGATGFKKWEFELNDSVRSCPAIASDGTVYVGSDGGTVYALDGATGRKKWEFASGTGWPWYYPITSPAIGADGTVYFGSGDKKVYALNEATGLKKWEFLTGYEVHSCPAIGADGTVYFGGADWRVYAGDWKIYALDGATGQKNWEFATGGGVDSSPVIGVDGTVYVGSDPIFYALDGATGQKKWEFQTENGVISAPAIGADGIVYIGAGGMFYALDGATGLKQWEFQLSAGWSSPAIGADGTIYVGTAEGKVCALVSSSLGGLAKSPWPKFHGNARNTGLFRFAPRIDLPLVSGVMLEGSEASLVVQVVGEPPPNYQWLFDGEPIPGATNSVYSIASVSASNAGIYSVIASNDLGSITNEPATLGVNNVVASNYLGLVLTAPKDTRLQVQSADNVSGPWSILADLNLTASPYAFIDFTATQTNQRFYRTTQPDRLEAWLFPGWTFASPEGSRYRIEYVNAEAGFTHWQFLTNLTLPGSPHLFIDTTATNKWPRYYRTTPLP
jgi:outer membrane protein assembly factor BamB